jgi:hypothetical protein
MNTHQRYADSIETSEGKIVRLSLLPPEQVIHIGKGRTKTSIKVKDIPLTEALLSCGDIVLGIAFKPGNVVFCDKHADEMIVEELVS